MQEEEAEAAGGVNGELEEAEDDAPEAVQAQNQHQSSNQQQWSTFPDLLRVQRSKCRTDSGADDHAAEGQEPGASQAALRSAAPSSIESNRSTGTVPKRMSRPSAPPDLTSRRTESNRNVTASHDTDTRVERLEREVDQLRTERVAMQQQRSTDEAKEAELRHVNEVHVQLAAISASVQTLNQSIHTMSQTVNQRLDQLETRLNSLVSADCATLTNDETLPLRRQIASLITNQRRVCIFI